MLTSKDIVYVWWKDWHISMIISTYSYIFVGLEATAIPKPLPVAVAW